MPPSADNTQKRLLDFVLLLACVFTVAWIFNRQVLPNLGVARDTMAWGSLQQVRYAIEPGGAYTTAMRGYYLAAWSLVVFVCYGFWRLRRHASLLRTLSLVAAPSCVLGMCLMMSQSLSSSLHARANRPVGTAFTPSQLDARQMWAALLWTKEQSQQLPAWTRGGHEQWMLPSGGILDVVIEANQITVRHPGLSPGYSCDSFARDLDEMRPPSAAKTRVVVDDREGLACDDAPVPRQFSLTVAMAGDA